MAQLKKRLTDLEGKTVSPKLVTIRVTHEIIDRDGTKIDEIVSVIEQGG
jgi:hypothetical protein